MNTVIELDFATFHCKQVKLLRHGMFESSFIELLIIHRSIGKSEQRTYDSKIQHYNHNQTQKSSGMNLRV